MSNSNDKFEVCLKCGANKICRYKDSDETLVKKCHELELENRFEFALNHNLFPCTENAFTSSFWKLHDIKSIYVPLKVIYDSYKEPKQHFEIVNQEQQKRIRQNLFIEILMKYCKLMEDLGGLLSSRDDDLDKFIVNYNSFFPKDVTKFYKNLNYTEEGISNMLYYPKIDNIKFEEKEKLKYYSSFFLLANDLKCIRDNYNSYREVYNSYKHGFRIRFSGVELKILNNDEDEIFHNVLIYYNLKLIKTKPGYGSCLIFHESLDAVFMSIYSYCLNIIQIYEIFSQNYNDYLNNNQIKLRLYKPTDFLELSKGL